MYANIATYHTRLLEPVEFLVMDKCLECEVKDAEIYMLHRRIELLEQVLALNMNRLQLEGRAGGISSDGGGGVGGGQVLTYPLVMMPSLYTTPTATSANHTTTSSKEPKQEPRESSYCDDNASERSASQHHSPSGKNCVELMAGSGVYVSLSLLGMALAQSKRGTQLARRLMDMLWDHETLAYSTISPRATSSYHQLDPNTIRAIEEYCLSFDKNTTSREVLASMNNMCSQARRLLN